MASTLADTAICACRMQRHVMQQYVAEGQMPTYDLIVEVYMPNLENLKKQAKLILRWHREGDYPVAAQIRACLPRFLNVPDSEILAASFKLGDAQEMVARGHGFDSWQALKTGLSTT